MSEKNEKNECKVTYFVGIDWNDLGKNKVTSVELRSSDVISAMLEGQSIINLLLTCKKIKYGFKKINRLKLLKIENWDGVNMVSVHTGLELIPKEYGWVHHGYFANDNVRLYDVGLLRQRDLTYGFKELMYNSCVMPICEKGQIPVAGK